MSRRDGRMVRGVRTALELARVIGMFAVAEVRVRRWPLARLAATYGVRLDDTREAPADSDLAAPFPAWARWRLRAVLRVARWWPLGQRGPCLRSALVLGSRLRELDPLLCLGVRRGEHGIEAHAWIEVAGRVLDVDATSYERLLGRVRP